jgi:hypothetical protein
MKTLAGAILLFLVLAISNPGMEEHKLAYREALKRESPVANFLGLGHVGAAMLTYDNFVVFSVSRMQDEVVGIGVLGFVLTGDRLQS